MKADDVDRGTDEEWRIKAENEKYLEVLNVLIQFISSLVTHNDDLPALKMIVDELDIKIFLDLLNGIFQTRIHGKEELLKQRKYSEHNP